MRLLPIPGAEVYYRERFLPPHEAARLFNALLNQCAWHRRKAAFGYAVPRDEAYYGDPGTQYTYSRRLYQPLPWIPELLALKSRIEQATPGSAFGNLGLPRSAYNAVLCNLYRNGNDSVGRHADAEPEMGAVIASLSLGVARTFRLLANDGVIAWSEKLPHGSLLIMAGNTQKNFKHEVPKEPAVTLPRINLTFRRIEHK
jgi:alkylated DNA repair dioxygenase AlkB